MIKSIIGRILFKKNFSYLKKKCPKLNINEVDKILDFFSKNESNYHKVETLKISTHSVVIKPQN